MSPDREIVTEMAKGKEQTSGEVLDMILSWPAEPRRDAPVLATYRAVPRK